MADAPKPVASLQLVPAVFFGMVLGLGGLGSAWRIAGRIWGYPAWIGEALCLTATAVWLVWLVMFALKWLCARPAALGEIREPTMSFSIGLVPMASLLASLYLKPYAPELAWWIFAVAAVAGVLYTAWLTGGAWQGGRAIEATTPLVYLVPVGAGFLGAIAAGSFNHSDVAVMLWGAGAISWLVWESVVLQRLMTHSMPVGLRATIGIQLAPPAVGCMSYLSFTDGPPDRLALMLLGYALLQGVITLRVVPWLREQPFGPAAWAYTFGIAAVAVSALSMVEKGQTGVIAQLALPLFVLANLFIGWIAVRTVGLTLSGRLFPAPKPSK